MSPSGRRRTVSAVIVVVMAPWVIRLNVSGPTAPISISPANGPSARRRCSTGPIRSATTSCQSLKRVRGWIPAVEKTRRIKGLGERLPRGSRRACPPDGTGRPEGRSEDRYWIAPGPL